MGILGLNFLLSALAPCAGFHSEAASLKLPPRRLDRAFSDVFRRDHQLLNVDPRRSNYLACALMVRGSPALWPARAVKAGHAWCWHRR